MSAHDTAGSNLVNHWPCGVPVYREPVIETPLLFFAAWAAIGMTLALARRLSPVGPFSGMNDTYAWGIWKTFNVMTLTALGSGPLAIGMAAWVFNRREPHVVMRTALLSGFLFYATGLVALGFDVGPLDQASWQAQRDKMLKTCNQCHSSNFAAQQLQYGDDMIRNADHLMAEAIRTVADLYKSGILPKPKNYAYPFPDLLTFHDAPTVIEQKLFVMYLEHRMRTFQGTFHSSPDYALWYGWSEMQRDLTEIQQLAAEARRAGHVAAVNVNPVATQASPPNK